MHKFMGDCFGSQNPNSSGVYSIGVKIFIWEISTCFILTLDSMHSAGFNPFKKKSLTKMHRKTKIIGIVLAGGESHRMKSDKAFIDYHGKPQYQFASDLLAPFCEEIRISCRIEQAIDVNPLHDDPCFLHQGPLSGLLTAIKNYPKTHLLVLGCDYPLVESQHLERLLKIGISKNTSAAFRQPKTGFLEPLIAFYHNSDLKTLNNFSQSDGSLRRFLEYRNTIVLDLEETKADFLQGVDDEASLQILKSKLRISPVNCQTIQAKC
ncbi:MAG: molybdenum cofactor guanylyltransferase [Flavobacteriaceae bacterium]|nr:molybdenum cofactor guanylyltransferase [Flavobacteriaceae bacterium]